MNTTYYKYKQALYKFSLFLSLFIVYHSANAQKFNDMFVSPNDGAVDVSGFLNSRTGFLPVPILITEPAVGYGGGLAIAYFHKKKDDKEAKGSARQAKNGDAVVAKATEEQGPLDSAMLITWGERKTNPFHNSFTGNAAGV